MYTKEIRVWMEAHREELLKNLTDLMRIDSSLAPAEEGAPFGKGAKQAFDVMTSLLEQAGFPVKNYDNYALAADYSGAEKALDVLCHLDVVPGQEGWKMTQPFEPKLVGDRLYGRGAADDKGPAIAAFYAMRALKELDIPMAKSLRLILGGDEETGSKDIDYYYEHEAYAPATISPDSSFPVVGCEKGIMSAPFELSVSEELSGRTGLLVTDIQSGIAGNMVPSLAEAKLCGADAESTAKLRNIMAAFDAETGLESTLNSTENGEYMLTVSGEGCHASLPELGKNALTGIITLLTRFPLAASKLNDGIRTLAKLFPYGDHYGDHLGIAAEDEKSGKLTLSFTVLHLENGVLSGRFDSRIPICAYESDACARAKEHLLAEGLTVTGGGMFAPHYMPEDSPLIQNLLNSYETVMGIRKKPLIIGGCTYIHGFPNAAAFGCEEPELDNRMHGQDEFIDVPHLIDSACILAEAYLRICGVK